MYQMRYEDIVEESALDARERECVLFERFINKLEVAQRDGPGSPAAQEAIIFARKLWIALIEDLGDVSNALGKELKASLISIGFFTLKEMERLDEGELIDFDMLIEISGSIRDGLK